MLLFCLRIVTPICCTSAVTRVHALHSILDIDRRNILVIQLERDVDCTDVILFGSHKPQAFNPVDLLSSTVVILPRLQH